MKMTNIEQSPEQLQSEHQDFIEKMGLMLQNDGLPRIAGRILGLLIITGNAYSFHHISSILQISRASVSTNTRLLERLAIIQRSTKPGHRQDFFALHKDPYKALIQSMQTRVKSGIDMVNDTIEQIDNRDHATKSRLDDLRSFYQAFYAATEKLS